MAKKEKVPMFTAKLGLTRISNNGVRYRVVDHTGAGLAISHVEFNRDAFPVDDNFNMDFMLKDLGKKAAKGVLRKQAKFRDFLSLDLTIK